MTTPAPLFSAPATALYARLEATIRETVRCADGPTAIMLSGGSTPLALYQALAAAPPTVPSAIRFFFSDDRHVPPASPDSNYGNALPFFEAAALDASAIAGIDAALPLDDAAAEYGRDLANLLKTTTIPLGILGMGSDGHTASLFDRVDAARTDSLAIAVPNRGGFDRVSVTRPVLLRVARIIIAVLGEGKREILASFLRSPQELPVGVALAGHAGIEVWTDLPPAALLDS